jgi:anthranilate synthase component 1
MPNLSREAFVKLANTSRLQSSCSPPHVLAVPLSLRLLSDQLTPVLAYRRLVVNDPREAPSFLLESVEGGERQGRYSILGAQPVLEVVAYATKTTIRSPQPPASHIPHPTSLFARSADRPTESSPFDTLRQLTQHIRLVQAPSLPRCVLGGWFGYAGYDTVRYAEPHKLPFENAPRDDRNLPDLHFAFYDGVVIFDHVDKLAHVVQLAFIDGATDPAAAYDAAISKLNARLTQVQTHSKPLPSGLVPREVPNPPLRSNITRQQHAHMVAKAKDFIAAGDIFQVVLGQRFERESAADPFDVYRALRTVNPSPYMVYMQAQGCILVASSPEILCRVSQSPSAPAEGLASPAGPGAVKTHSFTITNRPLAGTRRRGSTPAEDLALEAELLSDQKERAEHIMLVDLGRNDVGMVAVPGTIETPRLLDVERYSHVMHISSTVTGTLRPGLTCWDALRATLPVGTISGAPKIRAMQVIDELEPLRRGPYGGGMGYVGLDGQMDIALTLRTMVVPTALHNSQTWTYHLQAAGGIVADSEPDAEYQETVNKAAALARAISVAESAFGPGRNDEAQLQPSTPP